MIVSLRGECAPLERTMAGSERGPGLPDTHRFPPFGVARRPPFGGGNSNCRQSLGERESFSTKHTHLPLLMRANPSKATTCCHRSVCIDRLQPKKSQPRNVGVWDPRSVGRSGSTPRRRWVSWSGGPEVGVLVRWHSPVGPKSWTNSAPRPRRFWRVPARKCQPTCSRPSSPKNRPWCGQDAVRGPAG
jgi:hypothetical protein